MEPKIIKSFRKSIAIQIREGQVIVRAPMFASKKMIHKFIEKHDKWVKTQLETSQVCKDIDPARVEFYKKEAREYIPLRVEYYAIKYGFSYNKVKITSAKTRWGSCTSTKNLNFSYRLMATPEWVRDYVVVHEISHLKHMNHGKKFWKEVESMYPEYKKAEKWLKQNGNKLDV